MSIVLDIKSDNTMNNDEMDDDEIDDGEIFVNPFNYCDYWCEKCIAQEQCLIYNKELEEEGENAIDLIRQYIEDNNIHISELPDDDEEEDAEYDDEEEDESDDEYDDDEDEEEGYDEDDEDYDENEEYDDEEDAIDAQICREIEDHPLLEMCLGYMEKSEEFFMHYRERYLTPPPLMEAFSNLVWYRTLLPVKMERTLYSLYEFEIKEEEFLLQDALLTSLVVYKSLRKSLSAIKELKSYLVDYQEILTELEDTLSTINTELKHEFPFWIMLVLLYSYLSTPRFIVIKN